VKLCPVGLYSWLRCFICTRLLAAEGTVALLEHAGKPAVCVCAFLQDRIFYFAGILSEHYAA
jgi:hypothetical protein